MLEAYEVAIKLKLIDQFTGAMSAVNRLIVATDHQADHLERRMASINKLMTAGAATTAWGVGMVMAMRAATDEAVKYEQQLNRRKALNVDASQGAGTQANLITLAKRISHQTKVTSGVDALRLVTETQSITADATHTSELAPLLAKIRFGLGLFAVQARNRLRYNPTA